MGFPKFLIIFCCGFKFFLLISTLYLWIPPNIKEILLVLFMVHWEFPLFFQFCLPVFYQCNLKPGNSQIFEQTGHVGGGGSCAINFCNNPLPLEREQEATTGWNLTKYTSEVKVSVEGEKYILGTSIFKMFLACSWCKNSLILFFLEFVFKKKLHASLVANYAMHASNWKHTCFFFWSNFIL